MNSKKILFLGFVYAFLGISSSMDEKFQVYPVSSIKEIPHHGEIPYLEEHLGKDTNKFGEHRRLELCHAGLKNVRKIRNSHSTGKHEFLDGIATAESKVYALVDSQNDKLKVLAAYKCPTNLATYIHIEMDKNDQPIFQMFYEINHIRPIFKQIMFQLEVVTDIVEANLTEMTLASKSEWLLPIRHPDFDTDEFSEEERLAICQKGLETVPQVHIHFAENKKTSTSKYYTQTRKFFPTWKKEELIKEIVEAFECPTVPKTYITLRGAYTKTATFFMIIKASDSDRLVTQIARLRAISDKKTAEHWYLQIRNMNKEAERTRTILDPRTQNEMCAIIFTNTILEKLTAKDLRTDAVVDTARGENYEELKSQNPKLWERLYTSSKSALYSGEDIVLVSGVESINVTISEVPDPVPEDLFVCAIRNRNRLIEEYLVSKEYNMNNAPENYSPGRFIFKRLQRDGTAEMVALAEKIAEALKTPNVELLYLEKRKQQEPAKQDDVDALCKLSSLEKSRICALVFDFPVSGKKQPTPLYQHGCARNPITFSTEEGQNAVKDAEYFEFMISCYDSVPEFTVFSAYYLSYVQNSNHVFTYERSSRNSDIILKNAYNDMRITHIFSNK